MSLYAEVFCTSSLESAAVAYVYEIAMSLLKCLKKVDPVTASVGNEDATHALEVSGQTSAGK